MRSLRLFVEICDELCIIVQNILIIFFILQTVKRFLIQFIIKQQKDYCSRQSQLSQNQ